MEYTVPLKIENCDDGKFIATADRRYDNLRYHQWQCSCYQVFGAGSGCQCSNWWEYGFMIQITWFNKDLYYI